MSYCLSGPAEGVEGQIAAKPAASAARSKEFDPLSKQQSSEESSQNKVMSSFGIPNDSKYHYPTNCPFQLFSKTTNVRDQSAHLESILALLFTLYHYVPPTLYFVICLFDP